QALPNIEDIDIAGIILEDAHLAVDIGNRAGDDPCTDHSTGSRVAPGPADAGRGEVVVIPGIYLQVLGSIRSEPGHIKGYIVDRICRCVYRDVDHTAAGSRHSQLGSRWRDQDLCFSIEGG